jgi:hypothetical protein
VFWWAVGQDSRTNCELTGVRFTHQDGGSEETTSANTSSLISSDPKADVTVAVPSYPRLLIRYQIFDRQLSHDPVDALPARTSNLAASVTLPRVLISTRASS